MDILPLPLIATEKPRYELLNQQILPEVKSTLSIQVSQKLTKLELSHAARSIKYELCRTKPKESTCREIFPRVFIDWYLPGMEIGAGAWATTHFEPELRVNIMDFMLESNPSTIE